MVFNWLYLVSLLRILAALGSGVGAEGQAGRAAPSWTVCLELD